MQGEKPRLLVKMQYDTTILKCKKQIYHSDWKKRHVLPMETVTPVPEIASS